MGEKAPQTLINSFFQIQLHIDDLHALIHIRDTLGLGIVSEFKNTCIFRVDNFEGIKKITKIFEEYTLNSTKRLNFISFKEAFELYVDSSNKTLDLILKLEGI